jgi:hypothetical protein
VNPWTIVSWIGAICVALLILAVTVSILVNVIRGSVKAKPPRAHITNVFNSK